jgi:hypothetical protein
MALTGVRNRDAPTQYVPPVDTPRSPVITGANQQPYQVGIDKPIIARPYGRQPKAIRHAANIAEKRLRREERRDYRIRRMELKHANRKLPNSTTHDPVNDANRGEILPLPRISATPIAADREPATTANEVEGFFTGTNLIIAGGLLIAFLLFRK